MNLKTIHILLAIFTTLVSFATAQAAPGFTEDFVASNEGWLSGQFAPLIHSGSGGPDGGSYVSIQASFDQFEGGATAFRGHDDFDASSDAFVDDWISNHWVRISAFVRHDGPVAAEFFTRVATSANFPGAGVESSAIVQPNIWTQVFFNVSPNSSEITLEGPISYASVFGVVGNLQIGLTAPAGFEDDTTPITFALDKVSVTTPEPGTGVLSLFALAALCVRRRKK